jgi:hypothetical protein
VAVDRRGPWALVLLVACGDNLADVDDGARSGARLALRWYEFEDGSRQWEAQPGVRFEAGVAHASEVYFDRVRDEMCAAQPWLDGIVRCTPEVEMIDNKLFRDPQCTSRVTENPEKFRYVADFDPKCDVRRLWHVYPVTRVEPRTGSLFFLARDNRCYEAASSAQDIGVLGNELAADTFAALESRLEASGRAAIRYRESGDGMRVPLELEDTLLGPAFVFESRLQPRGSYVVDYYADDSCTIPVVTETAGCPARFPAVLYGGAFHLVGDRVTAPLLFTAASGACAPVPSLPGERDAVAPEATPLVAMTSELGAGAGARKQFSYVTDGTFRARDGKVFDAKLGTFCAPRLFTDAQLRCIPSPAAILATVYVDAACASTMMLARVPEYPVVTASYVVDDRTLIGGSLKIFAVGEPYAGAVYVQDAIGACIADSRAWFQIGRELSWDELAHVMLTRD